MRQERTENIVKMFHYTVLLLLLRDRIVCRARYTNLFERVKIIRTFF